MAKVKEEVSLLQSVVCDDIRREDTGKYFLIGVYTSGIYLNNFPANIVACFLTTFEVQIKDKIALEFEIKGDALQEPVTYPTVVEDKKFVGKKQIVPFVARVGLKIKQAGEFSISYRKQGTKAWTLINTVPIIKS